MKLIYYQGTHPNFGDDLNPWLWPKLIPDFFDEDESTVFIGIGSILGADFVQRYDHATRKIVFGSGYVPTYNPMPNVKGSDWDVYFVRGPRTARALNLPVAASLGDSAILVREVVDVRRRTNEIISFIPHWESMERGNWQAVCSLAGITLIDPRDTVDAVLAQLLRSKIVVAESLHGAIVADALRIPWIPIMPMNKVHREKWFDWAEALELDLQPHRVCPSTLLEARLSFMRKSLTNSPLAGLFENGLTHASALTLAHVAKRPPCLSKDHIIDRMCSRMLFEIDKLLLNENSRHYADHTLAQPFVARKDPQLAMRVARK